MSQILRLEYVCTDAEKRQAQTMALRTRLGGGSKWRTRLVLLLMLVGMLLGFYFRHQGIPRVFRLLAIAGVVGFSTAFVYWKNRSRGNPQVATTTVEASENEFAILGPDSKVRLPWSAFSRCLESPDLFVLLDRSEATLIVVPKRAFPSEDWQSWFRTQAKTPPNPANSALLEPATVSPPTPSNGIALKFQLGFRDYLDRSIASLRTWRVVSIVVVFFWGAFIMVAAHPPPNPVHSSTEVFIFMLPFFLVCVGMVIFATAFHAWRLHARYNVAQEVLVTEDAITVTSVDGTTIVPISRFAHYKETPRSFILWSGSVWLMFPKRAFGSNDDLHRCRVLLEQSLTASHWFAK